MANPANTLRDTGSEKPLAASAIELSGIVVTRGGKQVLDDLKLSFGVSGITAIMGPNGAGKSLLLRLIAGLFDPDSGSVRFTDNRPVPREIALVFQSPVLLRRSVYGNLLHALACYGTQRKNRVEHASELLEMADLSDHADRPARALSGGEKQRLALVRALGAEPKFLLLDEPTASLDPHATAMIEALIAAAAANGIRVLLVTHDQGQARRLADDVVFLHCGRVLETSCTVDFFDAPTSPEARAYLAGDLLI